MKRILALVAAGALALMLGAFTTQRAEAMPVGGVPAATDVSQVALCFYIDGWNGPGMYQCGFRFRRGHGWHGHRHGHRHHHHGGRHHHRGHRHGHRHGGRGRHRH